MPPCAAVRIPRILPPTQNTAPQAHRLPSDLAVHFGPIYRHQRLQSFCTSAAYPWPDHSATGQREQSCLGMAQPDFGRGFTTLRGGVRGRVATSWGPTITY